MSLTIGFPNASMLNIGGKAPSTESSGDATSETSTQGSALEGDKKISVSPGGGAQGSEQAESAGSDQSVAVQILLKRMQELQQQLREQQQQLAATQAASFQSAQAKATAVMAIQTQIADTSAALMQVAAALVKELAGSGSVISTTA
ncbi:MAG: hypothetical protein ACRESJ_05315 [Pseudomonas sp.]|uniref:hypothetical protein n=1 Tax=Pseudomonas sp. TaxID=306 RepID=UPI003D6F72B9